MKHQDVSLYQVLQKTLVEFRNEIQYIPDVRFLLFLSMICMKHQDGSLYQVFQKTSVVFPNKIQYISDLRFLLFYFNDLHDASGCFFVLGVAKDFSRISQ